MFDTYLESAAEANVPVDEFLTFCRELPRCPSCGDTHLDVIYDERRAPRYEPPEGWPGTTPQTRYRRERRCASCKAVL